MKLWWHRASNSECNSAKRAKTTINQRLSKPSPASYSVHALLEYSQAEDDSVRRRRCSSAALTAYLVVVGGDEPQLQVQVVVPLLHADEVEDVFVLHAAHAVHLILVLPGQLVLDTSTEAEMQMLFVPPGRPESKRRVTTGVRNKRA